MVWLILGVALWGTVHLLPMAGGALRTRMIERIGEGPYKGLFSLALLGAIGLMVAGWRSTPPAAVYGTGVGMRLVTNVMVFAALVLFFASGVPTNLKRIVRHPQLSGVLVWAVGHLVSNGEGRSLLLFGGLGLWAVVSMTLINRRDGPWHPPEAVPLAADLKPFVAAAIAFVLLLFLHPWIAGVPAFPR